MMVFQDGSWDVCPKVCTCPPNLGREDCVKTGRVMERAGPHFWNGAQRSSSINIPTLPLPWLLAITLVASPSLCSILVGESCSSASVTGCLRMMGTNVRSEPQTPHLLAPWPSEFLILLPVPSGSVVTQPVASSLPSLNKPQRKG